MFPRYGRNPDEKLPPSSVPVIGWKVRNLITGKHFNTPAGIHGSATWPLIMRDSLPASSVFLCEGESDTIRLGETDIPSRFSADVVCIPGVNWLLDEWITFIRSYERAWVIPDGDAAGNLFASRAGQVIPGVRLVSLGEGQDVCSFLMKHSQEDLVTLIQSAPLHLVSGKVKRLNWEWKTGAANDHRNKLMRIILQDVQLTKRGANEFVGLCPFHDEKTPSFYVNPTKGLYQCWGCGASGDVLSYLQKKRELSFKDALRALEDVK